MRKACRDFPRMRSWKWGWRNEDASAGAAVPDEESSGEGGKAAAGTVAGRCEGGAGYAGASREDWRRIEFYIAASRGGDSRRQGAAAAIGTLPEPNSGLYGR